LTPSLIPPILVIKASLGVIYGIGKADRRRKAEYQEGSRRFEAKGKI